MISVRAARELIRVAPSDRAGMLWWFSHPIDQSQPGAPACVPGNALYNAFHEPCDGD